MTSGTCCGVKKSLISVAPVPRTVAGLISGAVTAKVVINLLANAELAADRKKAPPTVVATIPNVSGLTMLAHGSQYLQKTIEVTWDMSSGLALTCA